MSEKMLVTRAVDEKNRFLANNSLMFERINEIEEKQLEYQKCIDKKFDKIFTYISEHENCRGL